MDTDAETFRELMGFDANEIGYNDDEVDDSDIQASILSVPIKLLLFLESH